MSFLQPTPAQSSSSSSNVNNGLITSTYGGQMNAGAGATSALAALLGVGGSSGSSGTPAQTVDMWHDGIPGNAAAAQAAGQPTSYTVGGTSGSGSTSPADAQAGYNNYLQLAGYAPAMRQLAQNITGQGAASGILNSGATAKALETRGAELNNQFFNNYLQQLSGLSGLGLQAGNLVANTGQVSSSSSTGSKPSEAGTIASTIGGIASIFSDRRLKTDIELVHREPDGLGVYICRYLWERKKRLMVMADEVAKFRPWALGPKRFGFATVNYGAL